MQSLSSNVFLFASKANTLTANGSVLIGGANSVRIFSAFGSSGFFSGLTEVAVEPVLENVFHTTNTALGPSYIDKIEPTDTPNDSSTADKYLNLCGDVSTYWSEAILVQSVWTLLMECGFALKGVKGAGGKACNVALATQLLTLTEWCAVRGVFAILSEPGPAGLDMYSLGTVEWATPGFTSCYSGSGIVMASGWSVGGLGLMSASVNAGINAVLKSPWRVGLDGKGAEAIAGTDLMLDAKKTLNLMGSNLQVGAVGGEALTQVPTVSIGLQSAKDLNVISTGMVKQLAGGTAGYSAATIKMLANTHIVLKNPAYEINISLTGISVSILKKTKIQVGASSVVADCMGGMSLEVDADGVTVGGSSAFLSVDATGSWVWQGPIVMWL